jgi:putative hydrolase of HD superfamily
MVNQLKDLYRQGWIKIGGEEAIHKCESVAEHCFCVFLIADSIIKKHNLKLDANKCMKMALVHELGEIIIGDFTPDEAITKEEKTKLEGEAVKEVLRDLDWADEYYDLWLEFESRETAEAIFTKEIDKLNFLMQGVCSG